MDLDINDQKGSVDSEQNSDEPKETDKDHSPSKADLKSHEDVEMECDTDSTVKDEGSKHKSPVILESGDIAVVMDCEEASTIDASKQHQDVIIHKELHEETNVSTDNETINPELMCTQTKSESESVVASVSSVLPMADNSKTTSIEKSELPAKLEHSVPSNSNTEESNEELVQDADVEQSGPSESEYVVTSDAVISSSGSAAENTKQHLTNENDLIPVEQVSVVPDSTIVLPVEGHKEESHPSIAETCESQSVDLKTNEIEIPSSTIVSSAEGSNKTTETPATESTDTTQLTNTTQSSDTTQLTNTTQSSDTTQSADTIQSADTTQLTDTTQSADTTQLTDTTQSSDTTQSTNTTRPSEIIHRGEGDHITEEASENKSVKLTDLALLSSADAHICDADHTTEKMSGDVSHSDVLLYMASDKTEIGVPSTTTLETDPEAVADSGMVSSAHGLKGEDNLILDETLATEQSYTPTTVGTSTSKSESNSSTAATLKMASSEVSDVITVEGSVKGDLIAGANHETESGSGIVLSEDPKVQIAFVAIEETKPKDPKTLDCNIVLASSDTLKKRSMEGDLTTGETPETQSAEVSDSGIVLSEEPKVDVTKPTDPETLDSNILLASPDTQEKSSVKGDLTSGKTHETESAEVPASRIVLSKDPKVETALVAIEVTKPKDPETLDSNILLASSDKQEIVAERTESIQAERSGSSDSPPNTECSDIINKTSVEYKLQTDTESCIKVLPTFMSTVSSENTEVEMEIENVTMSENMSVNRSNLQSDNDNNKSDVMKSVSSDVAEHPESTPNIDLTSDTSDNQAKESVAKEETNSVQAEEKTNLDRVLSEQSKDKNDALACVETTQIPESITEQEPAKDIESSKDCDDDDKATSVLLKDVDEDSCQVASHSSSAVDEDNDTASSATDSKIQGVASLCRDEDSRASFVSTTNETDMEVDLAADESNLVSDFNEDSNASKTFGQQPRQVVGNGKMFPLRDLMTDETSMSSVVTADSVDSENIPLARMVDDSDNCPLASLVPYSDSMPGTPASCDTVSDAGPTPAKRSRRDSLTNAVEDELNGFPAENLFEYQWPQDGGEWYMLQEQLSEFLAIKSFKRKYPDLYRRTADKVEKDFLRHRCAVTETQSDLGLTALRSEEVYDLMLKDYPDKYQEYANVLHEREKKTIRDKHKEYGVPKLDKGKMADYIKKAVRSAAEFNAHFQRERKEERRSYFDLQTFMIHYPSTKYKKLAPDVTKPGPYPVSLIPGQFQNFYKSYTPDELKYLPLNTVMFDPPNDRGTKLAKVSSGESSSEVEDNNEDKGESGSDNESDDDDSSDSDNSSSDEDQDGKSEDKEPEAPKLELCRICKEAVLPAPRRNSLPQDTLIKCSECGATGHPSCLDLPKKMIAVIKTYPWQCMECKTCVECLDPFDEDKMMFCDRCDRGYHTFCVGLKAIPTGRWECRSCKGTDTPKSRRGRH
ncbi:dentin sialophosphoprotein-like [Gigantopelta aegis]|uniref:dentin sialophosphoprotein-like n=1 Tax=Gigantopelta aegis TaxID=1735272 RepID=UPI001B88AC56|nr:dentin sialophosphoprotein-like [Gigantopelta aegis]XP_041353043.1 dentin sialophosphoprotein-like [Gigantopelta aegis]